MASLAELILTELKRNQVQFYVTVPDSHSRPLWRLCKQDRSLRLIKVCHEAEAVSVGTGLQIAGANCVVALENAGLFQAIEAIRCLPLDMRVPLVMFISWTSRVPADQSPDDAIEEGLARGGGAATHAVWQGLMTDRLLDAVGIPHSTLESPQGVKLVHWAFEKARKVAGPVAVLLGRLEGEQR